MCVCAPNCGLWKFGRVNKLEPEFAPKKQRKSKNAYTDCKKESTYVFWLRAL